MMHHLISYLSQGIELVSVGIIVYGTIIAIFHFLKNIVTKQGFGIRKIRADFGGYLLLGLELLIGADIINTIIEPSYEELIILAGVVVLRTILSVFLNKEIRELEALEGAEND